MGVEEDLGAEWEKLGRRSEGVAALLGEAASTASTSRWSGVVSERGVVTVVTYNSGGVGSKDR